MAGTSGALSPLAALAAVTIALGGSALFARGNSPDLSHLGIRRWYRRLDEPGFTPLPAIRLRCDVAEALRGLLGMSFSIVIESMWRVKSAATGSV